MHIISKFRDYYDVVAKQGMDRAIQYHRTPKAFETNDLHGCYSRPFISRRKSYAKGYMMDVYAGILGFCGKVIPYWICELHLETPPYKSIPQVFFGLESIKASKCFIVLNKSRWYKLEEGIAWKNFLKDIAFFEQHNIFQLFETPVYKVSDGWCGRSISEEERKFTDHEKNFIVTNPCLKNIHFEKYLDTYQTFQEIQMYISGVLGIKANPMVEIADKHRIEAHGFDKHSFRKEPWKKLKKRRARAVSSD